MKENIIGNISNDKLTISADMLIRLLVVPVASHLQNIQEHEEEGYPDDKIFPLGRSSLSEYIGYAFDGFIVDHFTLSLNSCEIDDNFKKIVYDYLKLAYQTKYLRKEANQAECGTEQVC